MLYMLELYTGGPSTGDGTRLTLDNTPAWKKLLQDIQDKGLDGADILLGEGAYWFSETPTDVLPSGKLAQLNIAGKGASEIPRTRLVSLQTGIRLHASRLADVAVYGGNNPTGGPFNGIEIVGPSRVENCFVRNFTGNGFHISAGVNRTPPTNANKWRIDGGKSLKNHGHGLYVDGGDTNGGICTHLACVQNGGWGIFESSNLGNTYQGCLIASNTAGAVWTESKAGCVFIGTYIENSLTQSTVWVAPRCTWIGSMGAPTGPGLIIDDQFIRNAWFSNPISSPIVRRMIGSINVGGCIDEVIVQGGRAWRFQLIGPSETDPRLIPLKGWLVWMHNGVPERIAFGLSTELASCGPGKTWLPETFFTGIGAAFRQMGTPMAVNVIP